MTSCTICGASGDEFNRSSIIVGELTLYGVNRALDETGHGPVCSRSCLFNVPNDVYPFPDYQIADRFKPYPQRQGY